MSKEQTKDTALAIDFAVSIWTGILLAFTLNLVDSATSSNQQAHSLLLSSGMITTSGAGTNTFAGFYTNLGLTLQNYFEYVFFYEIVIVLLLISSLWLSHNKFPKEKWSHPQAWLYWMYLTGFILLIALPFILRTTYINSVWFPTYPDGVTPAPIPTNLSTDNLATLIQIATTLSSAVIFSRYFIIVSRTIIAVGIFWTLASLNSKRGKVLILARIIGIVAIVVFLFLPEYTFGGVAQYQEVSESLPQNSLAQIVRELVYYLNFFYRYVSMFFFSIFLGKAYLIPRIATRRKKSFATQVRTKN